MVRHGGRLAVVLAAATAIVGVSSTAAFAGGQVYQGSDTAWVIGAKGVTLWVQDLECDNHGVYGEATWNDGRSYMSVHDADGCNGDTAYSSTFDGEWIDYIRVCEIGNACSPWKLV
jgi:hypothetical protein